MYLGDRKVRASKGTETRGKKDLAKQKRKYVYNRKYSICIMENINMLKTFQKKQNKQQQQQQNNNKQIKAKQTNKQTTTTKIPNELCSGRNRGGGCKGDNNNNNNNNNNDNNDNNSDFTEYLVLAKKTTVKQATRDIRPQQADTASYARYVSTVYSRYRPTHSLGKDR